MADLDEMSMMLGDIRASVRYAVEWMEKHEIRDQERHEKIVARLEAMADHTPRIVKLETTIVPLTDHMEQAKIREYKLAGALVVVGGLVSVAGTLIFSLWRNVADYFSG